MSIIDKKWRLFGKVSVIDLAVLTVVIVIGFVLLQNRFMTSEIAENMGEQKTVTTTVFFNRLTEEQVNVLQEGTARLQKTGRNANVEIVNIETSKAKNLVETREGNIVIAENPLYYEARVTVTGPGEVMRDKINIGTVEIKIGTDLRLLTKYFEGVGVIHSIDE
ncbi:MAG: DUF4330 domain-containing protein [Clostridiaceae bacterium]|nr:DUF4330 domain-containing protein [Clostridiaceae bacterium]